MTMLARVREVELDVFRKARQAEHSELTMTGMYNVLEKLRAGVALDAKEKVIHERGLVSVLLDIHRRLDAAVADAYGWPADLSAEAILERLVALKGPRGAGRGGEARAGPVAAARVPGPEGQGRPAGPGGDGGGRGRPGRGHGRVAEVSARPVPGAHAALGRGGAAHRDQARDQELQGGQERAGRGAAADPGGAGSGARVAGAALWPVRSAYSDRGEVRNCRITTIEFEVVVQQALEAVEFDPDHLRERL